MPGMNIAGSSAQAPRPATRAYAHKTVSQTASKRATLKTLGAAFSAAAARLGTELDRANGNILELLDLARRLDWITNRQRLIRVAERGGQKAVTYVFADCSEVKQIKSLAETATSLAAREETLAAALNLLIYIDLEMGWSARDMWR